MNTNLDIDMGAGFSLVWSVIVPVFEAPDETSHWYYARFLHQNWSLPVYAKQLIEASSPPLYYVLAAPLASGTAEANIIIKNTLERPSSPIQPRWFDDASRGLGKYWPIRWAQIVSVIL